jgi:hypothetical protein
MSVSKVLCAVALAACLLPWGSAASAGDLAAACDSGSLLDYADGAGGVPSACTLERGRFLIESVYFQNASAVGGTALAAYPMFRVRAGVSSRLELLLDTPSQVAESGLGGAGLYLMTNAGVGANYAIVSGGPLALTAGTEIQPPVNYYAPNREDQPKYGLNFTGVYQLNEVWGITGLVGGSTSHTVGFNHVFPGASFGTKISPNKKTAIDIDLGSRYLARHAEAQGFADVSVAQAIGKKFSLNTGLGTTFNPVQNEKSHYLAAGLNYKP